MRSNDDNACLLEGGSSHHDSHRRLPRRATSDDAMRGSGHSSRRQHVKRNVSSNLLEISSNHRRRPPSKKSSDDSQSVDKSFSEDYGLSVSSHEEHSMRKSSSHGRKVPSRRVSNDSMQRRTDEFGIGTPSHNNSSDDLCKSSSHGRKAPSRKTSGDYTGRYEEAGSHHGSRPLGRRSRIDEQDHPDDHKLQRRGSARGLLAENPKDTEKVKRRPSSHCILLESQRDSDRRLCQDSEISCQDKGHSRRRNTMDLERPQRRGSQRNLVVDEETSERPCRWGSQRNLMVDEEAPKRPRRRGSQSGLIAKEESPDRSRQGGSQQKRVADERPRRRGSQRNVMVEDDAVERLRRRGSQRNIKVGDEREDKPRRRSSQRDLMDSNNLDGKPRRSGCQPKLRAGDEDESPRRRGSHCQNSSRLLKTENEKISVKRFVDGTGTNNNLGSEHNRMPERRGSDEAAPVQNPIPGSFAIVDEDYESMRARIATRFTNNSIANSPPNPSSQTLESGEDGVVTGSTESTPLASEEAQTEVDNYGDALAKVAERFSSGSTRSSGKVKAQRRNSRKAADGMSQGRRVANNEVLVVATSDTQQVSAGHTRTQDPENSEGALLMTNGQSDEAYDIPVQGRGVCRRVSDDSLDLDSIIAETIHDEIESEQKAGGRKHPNLEDSVRILERQRSDGSMERKTNRDSHRGPIRRTTSADQTADFFHDIIGLKPKQEPTAFPAPKPVKKVKKSVSFKEDPTAKRGVELKIIENESPISPEEKNAGWFSGRDYKAFKAMCYSEATEAKGNRDLRLHFERVWKACSSDSIDFAWQEIMNSEHTKNAPNSAVVLAKARSRGYERDTYPEILLRNRMLVIKAVVKAYENSVLSMTLSPEDQAEAVRKASKKLTKPFRRFARLMAEGDSLLVMAWERVSGKKKKKEQEAGSLEDDEGLGDRSYHKYSIPVVKESCPPARSLSHGGDSRRALLESSPSCRRLLNSSNKGSRRDHLLDTHGIDSRRALLESSPSCRRLLDDNKGSRRDHLLDTCGVDSRRALLESSDSCRRLLDGSKGSRRAHLLDKRGIDSKHASEAMKAKHASGGGHGSDSDSERPEMDDSDNTYAPHDSGDISEGEMGSDSHGYICHYLKPRR